MLWPIAWPKFSLGFSMEAASSMVILDRRRLRYLDAAKVEIVTVEGSDSCTAAHLWRGLSQGLGSSKHSMPQGRLLVVCAGSFSYPQLDWYLAIFAPEFDPSYRLCSSCAPLQELIDRLEAQVTLVNVPYKLFQHLFTLWESLLRGLVVLQLTPRQLAASSSGFCLIGFASSFWLHSWASLAQRLHFVDLEFQYYHPLDQVSSRPRRVSRCRYSWVIISYFHSSSF